MLQNDGFSLPILIGNLISTYKKQKINDMDFYNSIIRLICSAGEEDVEKLLKIVAWLDKHEQKGTSWEEQYDAKNIKREVGNEYFEGLERIARSD